MRGTYRELIDLWKLAEAVMLAAILGVLIALGYTAWFLCVGAASV